jgi:2-oxoglutarate ferredoxin oxidoreductase subunit beta
VKKLEENPDYDSTNWLHAVEKSTVWGDEIPIGKFFERTDLPSLNEAEPVTQGRTMVSYPLHIDPAVAKAFVDELM